MPLKTTQTFKLSSILTEPIGVVGDAAVGPNINRKLTFNDGDAEADILWSDESTLAKDATENIDLVGVLKSYFDSTHVADNEVNFARIKGIYIRNQSTASSLIVGGAASNAWAALFGDTSDTLVIAPVTEFQIGSQDAIAYVVTAGTADILKMTHGGESSPDLTYEIVIFGNSS